MPWPSRIRTLRSRCCERLTPKRPTEQDVGDVVRAVETNVELALLLAPVDRAAARVLLDAAEARKDLIGSGGQNVRHREYLAAWCFVDPNRIVRLLSAEIEKLKASGQSVPERCDLLEVLGYLTTAPANRPLALSRMLWVNWPDPERIE